MDKQNIQQKKKVVLNYVYATLIAMLVIACAVTIALVNRPNNNPKLNIGVEDNITVSTDTYVVPIKNATIVKDYSATELQYNDTLKQWEIHKAIDLLASDSTDVMAVTDGTVSNLYTNYLEGTVIEISHSNGLVSVYKSLNKDTKVKVGDKVSAGQVIGEVSDTMAQELNSGAHLHFEMRVGNDKVNPHDYIAFGEK